MTGPCAKLTVTAAIVTDDGGFFWGTNAVRRPQAACPRVGDAYQRNAYELCRLVCDQPGHAEMIALAKAGELAEGATIYVSHHRICPDCQAALERAGIARIITGSLPPRQSDHG